MKNKSSTAKGNTLAHVVWIKVKDHLPEVPLGNDYIDVLAWHPEWSTQSVLSYWDRESKGAVEDESLWSEQDGQELDQDPMFWAYLPVTPVTEKAHTYDLIEHGVAYDGNLCLSKGYSLVDITDATHEIPPGIHSFKAYSKEEAIEIAKAFLEEI